MSLLQNNIVKNVLGDIAVYTAVDSLKEKQFDTSGLMVNSVTNIVYNLVVRAMVNGKLSGLFDGMSSALIEDYVGRLATLYVAEMFIDGKSREIGKIAKDQLYYSLAIYLTVQGYSQFGLKAVDTRAAPPQASTFRA